MSSTEWLSILLNGAVSDVLAPEDDLAVRAKLDDEDSGAQEAS